MIKLLKSQVETLREQVKEFDERPIGMNVVCSRVRELKYKVMETPSGWETILVPEDPIEKKTPTSHYPQFPGIVLAVGKKAAEEYGIQKGDLIRFSPLNAEVFSDTAGEIEYLNVNVSEIRIQCQNVNEYEGEEDPEKKSTLAKVN